MVDFSKLRNRAQMQADWNARADRLLKEDARLKLMVDKLYAIDTENDWVEGFVSDMRSRLAAGLPLTERQVAKIEELFERY